MLRALQPLPRLDAITLLRKGSRGFLTEGGPSPVAVGPWLGRLFLVMAGGFATAGLAVILTVLDPLLVLGRALSQQDEWLQFMGPAFLGLGLLDFGISIVFRKMAGSRKRLVEEGGLIAGELASARLRASKNGNYLEVECRFASPEGAAIAATKSIRPFDRTLKTPPPPGSKILILYAGPKLWEVL
jgi:hypothetical protein